MIDKHPDLSGTLSTDDIFELLSNEHRRELLLALLERDLRNDTPTRLSLDAIVEPENQELELCLYHAHLPKLEATAVIDWQRDSNRIRTGNCFDELRPLLRLLRENPDALPGEFP